jgi:transposase-like protein
LFADTFREKCSKAIGNLVKDKDELMVFYDFPAEHWTNTRSTNPIESMFAKARLITNRTKGSGSIRWSDNGV